MNRLGHRETLVQAPNPNLLRFICHCYILHETLYPYSTTFDAEILCRLLVKTIYQCILSKTLGQP
jgi:hypothetical protein